jgi:16S rRNA (cytosine967-C5)-methyltransferase
MSRPRLAPQPEVPGLAARRVAVDVLDGVLRRRRPLDEQLDDWQAQLGFGTMPERDRALARNIVATTLRRLGTLRRLVGTLLEKGLPAETPRLESALLVGATQILFLDVPDHAAVDLSVRLVQADRRISRYAGLANAVLRRVAKDGAASIAEFDAAMLDTPEWLLTRWAHTYGVETARAIAQANRHEPALDLTVRGDAASWATRLRGRALPTGSVRLTAHGPVTLLPGFSEGAWWVQDAAAALPARFFGNVAGQRIADLCAAPGGKTAQLAAAGALVTAVDRSERRLQRVGENLTRLKLDAELVVADASEWQAGPFDGVLIDAPCTSTGAIRRHPDIAWLKNESDLVRLTNLQRRLVARAADLVTPGGTIMFCTCSLEREEGEDVIADVLARDLRLRRRPIEPSEFAGLDGLVTPDGDLRTLPCYWPDPDPRMAGLDGFYAARLERIS